MVLQEKVPAVLSVQGRHKERLYYKSVSRLANVNPVVRRGVMLHCVMFTYANEFGEYIPHDFVVKPNLLEQSQ